MRYLINLAFISGLLVALNACDVATTDEGNGVTASSINTFAVEGNVDADERIVLPLRDDNAEVSASYDLVWDVVSSDPYTVEVFISINSVLDDTDEMFLQTECGTRVDVTCEHSVQLPCAIAFEPDYSMENLIGDDNKFVLDENGDPVMVRETNLDGSFVVEKERYFLRCPDGVATVRLLEITDRMPTPPVYPFDPFNSYFIIKVCASEEQSCPEFPFLVQFLSSQP